MNHNTPKHFALQIGSLISLYLSLSFLLVLLFGLINLKFPDVTAGYWEVESASSSVRLGIAMVIVFFPTYLVLTRMVNSMRREKNAEHYLSLTKWLIYGSLTIGVGVLLIDLAVVIMAFLEGELTSRFIYKAVAVLVVLGAAVHYYVLDVRGFWLKNESKSIMFGIGAAVAAFAIVSIGFSHIETPSQVREMKIDTLQISDLASIQSQIDTFLSISSSTLPISLEEAYEGSGIDAPNAPEGREAYSYEITEKGFALCATFAHDSVNGEFLNDGYEDPEARIKYQHVWSFKAGRYCFERTIVTK